VSQHRRKKRLRLPTRTEWAVGAAVGLVLFIFAWLAEHAV